MPSAIVNLPTERVTLTLEGQLIRVSLATVQGQALPGDVEGQFRCPPLTHAALFWHWASVGRAANALCSTASALLRAVFRLR